MNNFVQQWPTPTHSADEILGAALPYPGQMESGYTVTLIEVKAGESTWDPQTTKHVVLGPCFVQYTIHPSQVTARKLTQEEYDAMAKRINRVREVMEG